MNYRIVIIIIISFPNADYVNFLRRDMIFDEHRSLSKSTVDDHEEWFLITANLAFYDQFCPLVTHQLEMAVIYFELGTL